MKTNINIEDFWELYNTLSKSKFHYSDDLQRYNAITTVMERLRNCIINLNEIEILPEFGKPTRDFMMWIFYGKLLLDCFEKLEKFLNTPLQQKGNIFYNIHKISGETDNHYFNFIRAIVMPHSLSLDDKKQKIFTGGKRAYCPSVLWRDNENILVHYFVDEFENHQQYLTIPIRPFSEFIEDLCQNLKLLIPVVEQRKQNQEATTIQKIVNEHYDNSATLNEKITRLQELLSLYGDVDDKKGVSYQSSILKKASQIATFQFDSINEVAIKDYMLALSHSLDDMFDFFKQKRSERQIDDVIFPSFKSNTFYSREFCENEYEFNKLICENNIFNDFTLKFDFPIWFRKIKPAISKHLVVKKSINAQEKSYLATIALYFENEKNKDLSLLLRSFLYKCLC